MVVNPKAPVGGIENPQWDQKVFENSSPQTSIRVPYFRIKIGGETDISQLTNPGIKNLRAAGAGTFLEYTGFVPIEKYVTKLTVVETMEGPEQYEIDIVDPDMELMFSEHLYLGKPLYIDMGFWQGPQLIMKPIARGHIHTMDFSFPEDGLPKLTIKGFGLVWDVLDKEKHHFHISFDATRGSLRAAATGPLHKRTFRNVTDMLIAVAKQFDLKVEVGKTVPLDLQKQIFSTGESDSRISWNPPDSVTWNGYLRWLSHKMGCWYFIKGSYIHFHPAAWAQAPVMTRHDILQQKEELQDLLNRTSDADEKKAVKENIKSKDAELAKVDAQFKDINLTGLFELNWRMGNKNLLSFAPVSTDINTAGYIAMGMNPDTGDISYGDSFTAGNDAGKINCMDVVAKSNPKAVEGMDYNANPYAGTTEDDVTHQIFLQKGFIGPPNRKQIANAVTRKKAMGPQGPMNSNQAAGITAASFRNWMWFQEAKATCIGDIRVTCGMPVWVRGIGPRSGGFDSGKLCGKWYVFEVVHELTPDSQYICHMQLKRFWQYLNDFDKSTESKEQLSQAEKDIFVQSGSGTGNDGWLWSDNMQITPSGGVKP